MDIVEEIRTDREKGSRRLESEYRNGLRTLAMRFCQDPGDADELVNRTFAEVVANIDRYAEQSAFFGWMSKILVNLHAKDIRRKSNDGIVYSGDLPDVADMDAPEAIFRSLDASLLRDAIETLPADIRRTLLLHYFMEMPVKDVARFLAIPSGTVMWRLHYARQMLAAKLGAAAKKPGVRALLVLIALGVITAAGAAIAGARAARPQGDDAVEPSELRQDADEPPAAGQQADNSKEADEPSALRQDANVGGIADIPGTPVIRIGNPSAIGNTALCGDSSDSPPTTQTPTAQEPTMKSTSLLLATPLAALTFASSASDFTWMDSPADGYWNLSSLNWNSGEAWVDGNNAIFPASSPVKTVTLSAARTANDVTVNGTGWTFTGGKLMTVTGKFSVPFTASGQNCTLADGFGGDSVRIGGNAVGTLFMGWAGAPTVKTTTLEDTVTIAPNDRRCFGPDPSAPSTNIVISGTPSLYANGNINLAPNRVIRLESGKALNLGAASGKTLTLGPIVADPSDGQAYSTNTYVYLPSYWSGLIKFNPGAGATNDVGRMKVDSCLEVASGVTSIASHDGFTVGCGVNSPLYVVGNGSGYSDTKGNVIVSGGELYLPQGRYAEMSRFAQMTVRNGGKVHAPNIHWLMGMSGTGGAQLSVSNNGEFAVGTLRLGQGSAWPNTVNLGKDGTLRPGMLTLEFNNGQNVTFNFDGGRVQANPADDRSSTLFAYPTHAKWAGVHFYVHEGGAILDSTNGKHLWWGRPLESGVTGDGGLTCVMGNNKDVVLCDAAVSTYNGPTRAVFAGGPNDGNLQCRVANALPASTTLQIGPRATAGFSSSWSGGHDLDQTVARVEGVGKVRFCSKLVVTGGVSPVFDGAYGTLTFENACSLSGTYDIVGDATGCGYLKVAADQDISGLALNAGDMAAMDMRAPRGTYPILDAPNGYSGSFSFAQGFPKDKWDVRYTANGAFLVPVNGFVVVVR